MAGNQCLVDALCQIFPQRTKSLLFVFSSNVQLEDLSLTNFLRKNANHLFLVLQKYSEILVLSKLWVGSESRQKHFVHGHRLFERSKVLAIGEKYLINTPSSIFYTLRAPPSFFEIRLLSTFLQLCVDI